MITIIHELKIMKGSYLLYEDIIIIWKEKLCTHGNFIPSNVQATTLEQKEEARKVTAELDVMRKVPSFTIQNFNKRLVRYHYLIFK